MVLGAVQRPDSADRSEDMGVTPDDAKIEARLEEVLESIFCPIGGCWSLHGCVETDDEI